ncbi:hypothetical protein LTR37_011125 [Vermiconidia calcicola]|uniref:Uncharacterized protein n=1 Tax=Vermiconidia calcicola TaxID=1690605 RepID=A0ACC3N3G6_9PEZI|nr:hypothetical protein LTR37_011125 [Vermiconidia calcicola]
MQLPARRGLEQRSARWLAAGPTHARNAGRSRLLLYCGLVTALAHHQRRAKEEQYAQRGFVQHNTDMRFYAAIPLRGALGTVLGSLTIVDDAPRYGLSVAELALMEDVADTITEHLNATVVRLQRQRSERLIQSLGLFNTGKSSLRRWWLKQQDTRVATAGRHKPQKMTLRQRRVAANEEFGLRECSSTDQESSAASESGPEKHDELASDSDDLDPVTVTPATFENADAGLARDQAHVAARDFDVRRKTATRQRASPTHSTSSSSPAHSKPEPYTSKDHLASNAEFDLAKATRHTYARASNLMREALGADGVVFVNGSTVPPQKKRSIFSTPTRPASIHNNSNSSEQSTHLGESSDTDTSGGSSTATARSCVVDAFSTINQASVRARDKSYHFDVSEDFLARLIRRYSHGHIFNFSPDGACYSSSGEDSVASGSNSDGRTKHRGLGTRKDARRLGEIMAGARSIAFYPIWDELHGRWCSAIFVWSTSPLRHFDNVEDITYLASWSHSILAELGRLETIAADKAKGSFISSVSHELRSPLHGVLAGVEFLQETELTSFQQEMAHTIGMAGRTLLDTVNHILDFSKMSSFTRAQSRRRGAADAVRHRNDVTESTNSGEIGVTTTVNLARLTEETIETVVSAHRFQNLRTSGPDDLSVTLGIPWKKNWQVELQPGGWTRILANLVGNSLKYTTKGIVAIRLELGPPTLENYDIQRIRLIVQDTGIGIPKQFMSSGLYTPFKQVNSHSAGTGLGLSIVRQICNDMSADLNITSKMGEGTCATLDLEVKLVSDADSANNTGGSALVAPHNTTSRELNVERYHWITFNPTNADVPSEVGSSVLQTAKEWLGCSASQGPTLEAVSGPTVCAITEADLLRCTSDSRGDLRARMLDVAKNCSHVLVLANLIRSVSSVVSAQGLHNTPIFVHQPIGPQKLLRAITSDQSSTEMGFMNESRHFYSGALSTPMYGIRSAGVLGSKPPDSDFPWHSDKQERPNNGSTAGPKLSIGNSSLPGAGATVPERRASPSSSTSTSTIRYSANPLDLKDGAGSHEGGSGGGVRDSVLLVEDNEGMG